MTTLTITTVLIVIYGITSQHGYPRALALGAATPVGAAAALSPVLPVPTFYAVSLGCCAAIALQLLGRGPAPALERRRLPPGAPLLIVFVCWSIFVTLVAPALFSGMMVLTPAGLKSSLQVGVLSGTNVSQTIYLILAVCLVVFLARDDRACPEIIGLAAGAVIVLSLWRYFHKYGGAPFPENFFDNSPGFAFVETAPGGAQRFRGILSEPSGLAVACLVAISYMIPRAIQVRGWRRAGCVFITVASLYMGIISTSGTFVIASGILAVIALLTFLFGFLIRRTRLGALASITACLLVIVSLWLLPIIADYFTETINDKVGSDSYSDRGNADAVGYNIFVDTFGMGAGVGATRAASFLPGLLSASGLVGAVLFAAMLLKLFMGAAPLREYHPVMWALVAALIVKVIAGGDLSDTSGIFWMCVALLSRATLQAEQARRAALAPVTPVPV